MEIFLRVLPLLYAVQFAFFLMGVHGRPLSITTKPDPDDAPATARWLVSLNSWGVELKLVDKKSEEAEFARSALFSKHSEMQGWPKDHDFGVYKLEIENIFLIDWFGGPKPLTVAEYLHPNLSIGTDIPCL